MKRSDLAGALHDVGKMGIPGEILNKPGALDEPEWEIMKSHPEIGYRICLPLKKNLGHGAGCCKGITMKSWMGQVIPMG